jgi:hypothetical protein
VERVDRGLNMALAAVAIVCTCSLVLLLVSTPAVFSSRDNITQVSEGNELSGCRNAYSADMLAGVVEVVLALPELEAATGAERDELLVAMEAIRHETRSAMGEYLAAVERSMTDPQAFLIECRGGRT